MTLITRSFAEYYDELLAQDVTIGDLFTDIGRREHGQRSRIESDEWADFRDMLHVAGVWIGQKRERERGGGPKLDQFAMALYERQREVWFHKEEPRKVIPPQRPVGLKGFPMRAYRDLCAEEEELRRWLHGVECRLRENVERSCQDSYYVLTCFDQMYANEERLRNRIQSDEAEAIAAIRKSVFMVAPSDYYRQLVVKRFGSTYREPTAPPELTFDELEELKRSEVEAAEVEDCKQCFQFLQEAYDAQLFIVHHQEIVSREMIHASQVECLYPIVTMVCREDFSLLYYHTPAVALHVNSRNHPVLYQMCLSQIQHNANRKAKIQETLKVSREDALDSEKGVRIETSEAVKEVSALFIPVYAMSSQEAEIVAVEEQPSYLDEDEVPDTTIGATPEDDLRRRYPFLNWYNNSHWEDAVRHDEEMRRLFDQYNRLAGIAEGNTEVRRQLEGTMNTRGAEIAYRLFRDSAMQAMRDKYSFLCWYEISGWGDALISDDEMKRLLADYDELPQNESEEATSARRTQEDTINRRGAELADALKAAELCRKYPFLELHSVPGWTDAVLSDESMATMFEEHDKLCHDHLVAGGSCAEAKQTLQSDLNTRSAELADGLRTAAIRRKSPFPRGHGDVVECSQSVVSEEETKLLCLEFDKAAASGSAPEVLPTPFKEITNVGGDAITGKLNGTTAAKEVLVAESLYEGFHFLSATEVVLPVPRKK